MGEVVLDAGVNGQGLNLYAHCLRGRPGGVALVAINLDRARPARLRIPTVAQGYALSADQLESDVVRVNGRIAKLRPDDGLPVLQSRVMRRGTLSLEPASITFLALPDANNRACR